MRKGFTLVELLAVIIILGIILLIIVPNVAGILNRSQERLNEEQIREIESAAKQWGLRNLNIKDNKPYKGGNVISYVTIDTLQKEGFLVAVALYAFVQKEIYICVLIQTAVMCVSVIN